MKAARSPGATVTYTGPVGDASFCSATCARTAPSGVMDCHVSATAVFSDVGRPNRIQPVLYAQNTHSATMAMTTRHPSFFKQPTSVGPQRRGVETLVVRGGAERALHEIDRFHRAVLLEVHLLA